MIKHGGIGNIIARATRRSCPRHDGIPDPRKRNCWYGKHSAVNKGGTMIGKYWCCEKCKKVVV